MTYGDDEDVQVDIDDVVIVQNGSKPLAGQNDTVVMHTEEAQVNIEPMLESGPPDLSLEQKLAYWYAHSRWIQNDILGELGGRESLIISIESLILHFATGSLYKDTLLQPSLCFLIVISRIETFLQRITKAGVNSCRLVSFDCFNALLLRKQAILVALRVALIRHLQASGIQVYVFDSWLTDEYRKFLTDTQAFVLLCEESSSFSFCESSLEAVMSKNTELENAIYKPAEHGFSAIYSLLHTHLCYDVSVASLYQLSFVGTRIIAHTLLRYSLCKSLIPLCHEAVQFENKCEQTVWQLINTDISLGNTKQLVATNDAAILRTKVFLQSAAAMLADCVEESQGNSLSVYFRVLLLSCLLNGRLSLDHRRCNYPLLYEMFYTLNDMFGIYFSHYSQQTVTIDIVTKQQLQHKFCLADFYDERLLRKSYVFLLKNSGKQLKDLLTTHEINILSDFIAVLKPFDKVSILPLIDNFLMFELSDDDSAYLNSLNGLDQASDNTYLDKVPVAPIVKTVFTNAIADATDDSSSHDYNQIFDECLKSTFSSLYKSFLSNEDVDISPSISSTPSSYDLATSLITIQNEGNKTEYTPAYILALPIEKQARALQKYHLRKIQDETVFARNVNKYLGNLNNLHRPIVIIGGRCSSDHPWLKLAELPQTSTQQKQKENKKKSVQKTSAKASTIIENTARKLREKKEKDDKEAAERLIHNLNFILRKKSDSPAALHTALLELLLGPRNAHDITVITDFTYINSLISSKEIKLDFLLTVVSKLTDLFARMWTFRMLESTKCLDQEILKNISLLFRTVEICYKQNTSIINGKQVQTLQSALRTIGMKRSANNLFEDWVDTQVVLKQEPLDYPEELENKIDNKKHDKAGSKSASKKTDKINEKVIRESLEAFRIIDSRSEMSFDYAVEPEKEAQFQLKYLGADLARSLGSKSDPRVNFKPDQWQIELLDCVDSQTNCLVVAPTASGKTFACYYCMDQVLRYDDQSVVVFVSPTRALALQVENEIIARFSGKTYATGSNMKLYGRLYEERSQDWENCQILVTVPSMLEIVMSSTNPAYELWRKRLKYCIIDEIHCISNLSVGTSLQHLIQLLPCPFMALSATIKNEKEFNKWLQDAHSVINVNKIKLICYSERYADLQTLYYSSKHKFLFRFNPLLCVKYEKLCSKVISKNLSLTPADCLAVFDGLVKLFAKYSNSFGTANDLQKYYPENYFANVAFITKANYRAYVYDILQFIEGLCDTSMLTKELWDDFINILSLDNSDLSLRPWYVINKSIEDRATTCTTLEPITNIIEESSDSMSVKMEPDKLLVLIKQLDERQLLPAIIFNFNRTEAVNVFYRVVNHIIQCHYDKYHGTPERSAQTKMINKERQDNYEKQLQQQSQAEKWKSLTKAERKEQGIDDLLLSEMLSNVPRPPVNIEDEHDSDFYICDKRTYMSFQEEYDQIVRFCKLDKFVSAGKVPPILLEALKRGIGLYHDSLTREYRRAVEFLFRARYLKVIISDAALSVGINIPCRTTVFSGSPSNLTALLFRQASGRAGRRGYDAVGYVVFWDFDMRRMNYLISSELNGLYGDAVIKPSIVLNKLDLMNYNYRKINQLYSAKPNILTRKISQLQRTYSNLLTKTLHRECQIFDDCMYTILYRSQYRLILEFCSRTGLLKRGETIVGLSAIIKALGSHNNNSFFFVFAMLKGYLTDLKLYISKDDQKKPSTLCTCDEKFFSLIEHIINPHFYNHSQLRRLEFALAYRDYRDVLGYNAKENNGWGPLIEPMNNELSKIASRYDNLLLNCYLRLFSAIAYYKKHSKDEVLPYSHTKYEFTDDLLIDSNLKQFLVKNSVKPNPNAFLSVFENSVDNYSFTNLEAALTCMNPTIPYDIGETLFVSRNVTQVKHVFTDKTYNISLKNSYIRTALNLLSYKRIIYNNSIEPWQAWPLLLNVATRVRCLQDSIKVLSDEFASPNYLPTLYHNCNILTSVCKDLIASTRT